MKFLLDVCVCSRALVGLLAGRGHEVASGAAAYPTESDEQLLHIAAREDRILITEDKDFGELVFVRGLHHGPIVRLVELSIDQQVVAVRELLDRHSHELTGRVLITVTRARIRIRRRP